MKTKAQKQREAEIRQEAYNEGLDAEIQSLKTASGRLSLLKDVSPTQRARLANKFGLNPETGEKE